MEEAPETFAKVYDFATGEEIVATNPGEERLLRAVEGWGDSDDLTPPPPSPIAMEKARLDLEDFFAAPSQGVMGLMERLAASVELAKAGRLNRTTKN